MDYATIKTHVDMNRLLDTLNIERKNNRCSCPLHGGDNKTAFSVHSDAQGWTCHTKCGCSGDIFTFIEKYENCDNAQARVRIMDLFNLVDDSDIPAKRKPKPKVARTVVGRKEYVYRDEEGNPLYSVNRVDYSDGRKDCFQSYKGKPHLPASVRTLYNLHLIKSNTEDFIVLCEGEKTADALTDCSYIATTNPLGSGNWEDEYAQILADQKIILMPDADEQGEKWRDEVIASLQGVVEQIQVVNIPNEFVKNNPQYSGHDFADYLREQGKQEALIFMMDSIESSKVMPRGVDAELLGRPCDIMRDIVARADSGISTTAFNLNEWLPSLNIKVKWGDLIVLMGNTGTGKTRVLHNIPFHIRHLNFIDFDLELSKETLALRYAAMKNQLNMNRMEWKIENKYDFEMLDDIDHVFLQKVEGLTVSKIKDRVDLIERVSKRRMHIVAVDYIGLMAGAGSSYEKTSSNVEAFKAYCSAEDRVGILTTQVTRPEDRERGMFKCPNPLSAKNSGSVENSSQELIGFWKDEFNPQRLHARCMKYSHGDRGEDVALDANDLLITEAMQ